MLVQLSRRAEALTINDGKGRILHFRKGDPPRMAEAARVLRFIEAGVLEKAEFPGIDNDQVVAVDVDNLGWEMRPVGPLEARA